jgi:hypothetical protein
MIDTCSLVLLLDAWSHINSKQKASQSKALKQVHSVLEMLIEMEDKCIELCYPSLDNSDTFPELTQPALCGKSAPVSLPVKSQIVIRDTISELARVPQSLPDHSPSNKKRSRSRSPSRSQPTTFEFSTLLSPSLPSADMNPVTTIPPPHYSQPQDFGFLDSDQWIPSAALPASESLGHFEVAQRLWDAWTRDKFVITSLTISSI